MNDSGLGGLNLPTSVRREIEVIMVGAVEQIASVLDRHAAAEPQEGAFDLSLTDTAAFLGLAENTVRARLDEGAFAIGMHYINVGTPRKGVYRFSAWALQNDWLKKHPEERCSL